VGADEGRVWPLLAGWVWLLDPMSSTHNEVRFAAVPLSGDRADSALRRDITGGALECVIRDEGFNGKCSGPVAAN